MKSSGAIVGAVVIVAAFAAINVAAAAAQPTAVKIEPDPHTQAQPTPTVAPTTPPAPATLDAYDILAERGEPMVQVFYSTDPAVNCGLTVGTSGGCFHPEHPETIVLSPDLEGAALTYIVLHELAHVRQHRHGVPLDECEADAAAVAWGADESLTTYLPHC